MNRKRSPDLRQGTGLGTFGVVFTPSVLTILGIIFFRRLGFVVGSAGLTRALLMLALASASSVLTSVSLSAIGPTARYTGVVTTTSSREPWASNLGERSG